MPRPRFDRLPADRRREILDAAFAEFAGHGYAEASMNRIIEAAGMSKGSMYYYVDDKHDLHAAVVRHALRELVAGAPPSSSLPDDDPDTYWQRIEEHAVAVAHRLASRPGLLALLRDALTRTVPRDQTNREVDRLMQPWLADALHRGQACGAVRTDLPADLILAAAMGLGQGVDTWLVTQAPQDADLAQTVPSLVSLVRSALSP